MYEISPSPSSSEVHDSIPSTPDISDATAWSTFINGHNPSSGIQTVEKREPTNDQLASIPFQGLPTFQETFFSDAVPVPVGVRMVKAMPQVFKF
jgi:hypothetical protein